MKIDCNTSLEKDHTVTNACMVNCGSRCALRVHVEGERVVRIETDNSGEDIYGGHIRSELVYVVVPCAKGLNLKID